MHYRLRLSRSVADVQRLIRPHNPRRTASAHSLTIIGLCVILALSSASAVFAAKRKARPIIPPELRILSVVLTPNPYTAGSGTLDFMIQIELPKEIDLGALLEVSSLISSPSMRSMRFLSSRQPVAEAGEGMTATPAATERKSRIEVTLSWDGLDQAKEVAHGGEYSYEIRAKLLTVGENGPRTRMVSWPKRGTVIVK